MTIRVSAAFLLLASTALVAVAGQPAERRVVRVTAERFSFTPSVITLAAGEDVELRIKSDDTSHGFRLVGTDTNVAIPKRGRGESVVPLRLDTPGRYTFECSRMCGAGHNFMRGEIVVRERPTSADSR